MYCHAAGAGAERRTVLTGAPSARRSPRRRCGVPGAEDPPTAPHPGAPPARPSEAPAREAIELMDVVMPRMGETVDEGTVNVWHKAVGDRVAEGEPLVEIGTDKVDTDIPAPVSGTLAEIKVEADQTVPVGTVIAVIQ